MKRLWLASLVGLVAVMSACSLLPTAPDPAATEAAIQRAVLATVTAAAALASATVAATPVPATPTSAPARPTAVAATSTPAAIAAGTGLATGTARQAGTRTVIPLTAEEVAYLRVLSVVIREYNQSFDRFRELFRNPEPDDASWRLRLGAELQLWAERAEPVRRVVPPYTMASVHRRIVAGVDLYQQASQTIPEAFRTVDQAGLIKALDGVVQARTAFDDAEREVARLAQERGL